MKITRKLFRWVLAVAGITVLSCSISSRAGVAFVFVGTNSTDTFTPAVTNISTGDSVVWIWPSSGITPHNTTNLANLWGSGNHTTLFSFTNKFNSAGSFPYECSIHVAFGMTGTINVAAVGQPPLVAITNPVSGTVFAAPANVTIRASASGNGGTLTNVEFLVDSSVLGDVTTAPYSAVASSLTAGAHTLSAIAANNSGLTATSSIPISVVNPGPIILSAPAIQSPASFQFSYTATNGLSYVVQRSTDLSVDNWTSLATNLAGSSSVTFTDINATVNPAYYRVGLLPNP